MTKNILDLEMDRTLNMDMRGTPSHICVCGSDLWRVIVMFDDFEIGTYFLDMECFSCGTRATAPTPEDRGFNND